MARTRPEPSSLDVPQAPGGRVCDPRRYTGGSIQGVHPYADMPADDPAERYASLVAGIKAA